MGQVDRIIFSHLVVWLLPFLHVVDHAGSQYALIGTLEGLVTNYVLQKHRLGMKYASDEYLSHSYCCFLLVLFVPSEMHR